MSARSLRARLTVASLAWAVAVMLVVGVMLHLIPANRGWGWRIHFSTPLLAGLAFIVIGLRLVRQGLAPFHTLRQRLADIRDGRSTRLDGDYPAEVLPLVDDLNALLDERERRVARAVTKAGDLAHGLKTPLAILTQDIERAAAAGQVELADSLRQQVTRMRRQIDSHLSQARAAAGGATPAVRTNLADAADGLVRTMTRLHADRTIRMTTAVDRSFVVRVPLEDLEEMLGNLLDNACKWATGRVDVSATVAGDGHVRVLVDDDGHGLPELLRDQVLARGVRADEAAPGSGLGLAIVRDLADAYGGTIVLDASPLGGLRAVLTLPAGIIAPDSR